MLETEKRVPLALNQPRAGPAVVMPLPQGSAIVGARVWNVESPDHTRFRFHCTWGGVPWSPPPYSWGLPPLTYIACPCPDDQNLAQRCSRLAGWGPTARLPSLVTCRLERHLI